MPSPTEFKKGQKRGPGRPPGTPNKVGKAAKDAISEAAEGLGGSERLIEWARSDPKNEQIFWGTIYPKLIPVQLTGENGGAVKFEVSAPWLKQAIQTRNSA